MASLLLYLPKSTPITRELGSRTVIGRHKSSDLVIPDSSVSKQHCMITMQDDICTLSDLGSTNGTYLAGRRLKKVAKLKNGDQLKIGEVSAILIMDPRPGPSPRRGESARATVRVTPASAEQDRIGCLCRIVTQLPLTPKDERGEFLAREIKAAEQVDAVFVFDERFELWSQPESEDEQRLEFLLGMEPDPLGPIWQAGRPMLIDHLGRSGGPPRPGPVSSLAATPLTNAGGRRLGMLVAVSGPSSPLLVEENLRFLGAVGQITATVLDGHRQIEKLNNFWEGVPRAMNELSVARQRIENVLPQLTGLEDLQQDLTTALNGATFIAERMLSLGERLGDR